MGASVAFGTECPDSHGSFVELSNPRSIDFPRDGICVVDENLDFNLVTSDWQEGFGEGYAGFIALPDGGNGDAAKLYFYVAAGSLVAPTSVTCPSATISETETVTSINLADSAQCSLTARAPAGDDGAEVTLTGTLARTGERYTFMDGIVTGAPFSAPVAVPVAAPVGSATTMLMGFGGIGIAGFGFNAFLRGRKRSHKA